MNKCIYNEYEVPDPSVQAKVSETVGSAVEELIRWCQAKGFMIREVVNEACSEIRVRGSEAIMSAAIKKRREKRAIVLEEEEQETCVGCGEPSDDLNEDGMCPECLEAQEEQMDMDIDEEMRGMEEESDGE